jgi:hypothetical protein
MNQGRFCSKNIYIFLGKGSQIEPVEKSSLAGQKAGIRARASSLMDWRLQKWTKRGKIPEIGVPNLMACGLIRCQERRRELKINSNPPPRLPNNRASGSGI